MSYAEVVSMWKFLCKVLWPWKHCHIHSNIDSIVPDPSNKMQQVHLHACKRHWMSFAPSHYICYGSPSVGIKRNQTTLRLASLRAALAKTKMKASLSFWIFHPKMLVTWSILYIDFGRGESELPPDISWAWRNSPPILVNWWQLWE